MEKPQRVQSRDANNNTDVQGLTQSQSALRYRLDRPAFVSQLRGFRQKVAVEIYKMKTKDCTGSLDGENRL